MAWYPELKGPALDAYRKMVKMLKERAMRELNLSESEIVVRDLRPADLGQDSSTPDYNVGLTALTWTPIVNNVTISDNRFIGINGFMIKHSSTAGAGSVEVDVPVVEQIRITRKGTTARYWQVKQIGYFENNVGYCDDPVTVDQNTTITIEGLARTASSLAGKFDILGVVVEKKGILVSP
ncbi:MAG: hypothetical protein J7J91_08955 [Deltaproteobacteria bacterium]|nr:hypothetical protein [Deltaproteobacteria bacterium]